MYLCFYEPLYGRWSQSPIRKPAYTFRACHKAKETIQDETHSSIKHIKIYARRYVRVPERRRNDVLFVFAVLLAHLGNNRRLYAIDIIRRLRFTFFSILPKRQPFNHLQSLKHILSITINNTNIEHYLIKLFNYNTKRIIYL